MSAAEKKKIRNKRTAMQSRVKEKLVKMHLTRLLQENSQKCEQFIDIMVETLQEEPNLMSQILRGMKAQKIEVASTKPDQFRNVLTETFCIKE